MGMARTCNGTTIWFASFIVLTRISATDLGLPLDRAEGCADEYALAESSWGPVFDDLVSETGDDSPIYTGGAGSLTESIIATEVFTLNGRLHLPDDITIAVESCDEANAFYDLDQRSITICTEFEAHLRDVSPVAD